MKIAVLFRGHYCRKLTKTNWIGNGKSSGSLNVDANYTSKNYDSVNEFLLEPLRKRHTVHTFLSTYNTNDKQLSLLLEYLKPERYIILDEKGHTQKSNIMEGLKLIDDSYDIIYILRCDVVYTKPVIIPEDMTKIYTYWFIVCHTDTYVNDFLFIIPQNYISNFKDYLENTDKTGTLHDCYEHLVKSISGEKLDVLVKRQYNSRSIIGHPYMSNPYYYNV